MDGQRAGGQAGNAAQQHGQGLRIGTSINSIGNKLSKISVMTPDEHSRCEGEIDKFLNNQVYIDGVRVKVTRYQI